MHCAILCCADNGPCKHLCNIVDGDAVCSCMAGYTLMADGVSCEGECFGLPTEPWLNVCVAHTPGCSSFSALGIAVPSDRPFGRRSPSSPSQTPPEGTAWLSAGEVEASLGWCFFPLTLQAFLQPFWFLFPLCSSPGSMCTAVDTQHSGWEQEQRAGLLCCPGHPQGTALP